MRPKEARITWYDPTYFRTTKEPPDMLIEYITYGILQKSGDIYRVDCTFPDVEDTEGLHRVGFNIPKGCINWRKTVELIDKPKLDKTLREIKSLKTQVARLKKELEDQG